MTDPFCFGSVSYWESQNFRFLLFLQLVNLSFYCFDVTNQILTLASFIFNVVVMSLALTLPFCNSRLLFHFILILVSAASSPATFIYFLFVDVLIPPDSSNLSAKASVFVSDSISAQVGFFWICRETQGDWCLSNRVLRRKRD